MANIIWNDYPELSQDELRERIAERAYARAEQRGFIPGYEMEDWIEAEKEVRAECLAETGDEALAG